jgi:hypothetical protein
MTLSLARLGLMGGIEKGSLKFISELTMDGTASSYDITSIQEDTYDVHFLTAQNVYIDAAGDRLKVRFFESGTKETSSVYDYATQQNSPAGHNQTTSESATDLPFIKNTGTSYNSISNGQMYVYNAGDSSLHTFNSYHSTAWDASGNYYSWFGSGHLHQNSTVDGFNFFSSANISGTVRLYGVEA